MQKREVAFRLSRTLQKLCWICAVLIIPGFGMPRKNVLDIDFKETKAFSCCKVVIHSPLCLHFSEADFTTKSSRKRQKNTAKFVVMAKEGKKSPADDCKSTDEWDNIYREI